MILECTKKFAAMTTRPDIKFFSLYALRYNYKKLQKSKEHIIISNDCFWQIKPEMLHGIDYEIYIPNKEWIDSHNFSPSFQFNYKEMIIAANCNDEKYVDEVIFVGMPWELDKANKYFGDAMLLNAYDI